MRQPSSVSPPASRAGSPPVAAAAVALASAPAVPVASVASASPAAAAAVLGAGPDPVPAEQRAIIELFTTELAGVSFPDVDGAILRRQLEELQSQHQEVEKARAALEAAAEGLERRTAELQQLTSRGLAYARIYADAHAEQGGLLAKLARIESREPADASAAVVAPRRGRKRAPRPELPFEREPHEGRMGEAAPAMPESVHPLRVAEAAR